MKFSLEIELGNDAMELYPDIALALEHLSDLLTTENPDITDPPHPGDGDCIRDPNGNTVGNWTII